MKVVAIVGKKKSGKTTLIAQVVEHLKEYGKVGCIKHAHELDLDAPLARDTDRFFHAGAEVVIGASMEKTITIRGRKELTELIGEMAASGVDYVLVEGFKSSDLPKIALSEVPDVDVSTILTRVDLSVDPKLQKEKVKTLVQLIRSLHDY